VRAEYGPRNAVALWQPYSLAGLRRIAFRAWICRCATRSASLAVPELTRAPVQANTRLGCRPRSHVSSPHSCECPHGHSKSNPRNQGSHLTRWVAPPPPSWFWTKAQDAAHQTDPLLPHDHQIAANNARKIVVGETKDFATLSAKERHRRGSRFAMTSRSRLNLVVRRHSEPEGRCRTARQAITRGPAMRRRD